MFACVSTFNECCGCHEDLLSVLQDAAIQCTANAFGLIIAACVVVFEGPSSFQGYTDPETGKQGNGNIGVTIGKFRDNQLVRTLAVLPLYYSPVCVLMQPHPHVDCRPYSFLQIS